MDITRGSGVAGDAQEAVWAAKIKGADVGGRCDAERAARHKSTLPATRRLRLRGGACSTETSGQRGDQSIAKLTVVAARQSG